MSLDPTHLRATPSSDELEATAPRQESWVGHVIDGRYRLEARLAAGGMGEVYKATHVELGRPLALKMMRPELSGDPAFVERFRREAMTASQLGHPHIVDIIDSGRAASGQFYFVMEFLDGEPMSALIARGPVPLPTALELVSQMAEALDVAHRAGVVHRDLKPDNVIVLQRGGQPFVKLVDFGIAKVVTPAPDQKQTTHGVIMGTPQYMAPEQAAGVPLDGRADLYALGLILFELLTGKPPLTGETAALVMAAHINQPPTELPPSFPEPLRKLVAQLLAKRPGERPESMAQVLTALRAMPRHAGPRLTRKAAVAAGLGLVALGAVAVAVPRRAPPPAPAPAPAAHEVTGEAPSVLDAGPLAPPDVAPSAVAEEPPLTAPRQPAPPPAPKKPPPRGSTRKGAAPPEPPRPTGIITDYPGD